jgi:LysM repeat protein
MFAFQFPKKLFSPMSAMRTPGKKSGNNTLIFIAGGLAIVLVVLILVGSGQQSTIDQLLMSAAPDSSAYQADSSQMGLVAGEPEPETPAEVAEVAVEKKDSVPSAAVAPSPVDSAKKPAEVLTITQPVIQTEGGQVYLYKIKKGDTMYKIAAKFGNKPADVLALNGLTDMSVQADKEIKVKIKAVHSVAEAEGLLAISEKYAVPAKSIKVANGLTSDNIPSGSKLIIPLK